MNYPQSAGLRAKAVAAHYGFSVATLYRLAKQPGFPKPRHLGKRVSIWMRDELDAYMASLGTSAEA